MGWDSCDAWKTVTDVVKAQDDARAQWKELARASIRAGVHAHVWTAYEVRGERFVMLDLVERRGGGLWVKAIGEDEGPLYFDCPESVIQAAGPTTSKGAFAWRASNSGKRGDHAGPK